MFCFLQESCKYDIHPFWKPLLDSLFNADVNTFTLSRFWEDIVEDKLLNRKDPKFVAIGIRLVGLALERKLSETQVSCRLLFCALNLIHRN